MWEIYGNITPEQYEKIHKIVIEFSKKIHWAAEILRAMGVNVKG
jgi:hypothetical protein